MNKRIQVEHPNGYYGELYGKSSLSVFKGSREVFHTGFRNIETAEELYQLLENYPEFEKLLCKVLRHVEENDNQERPL